MATKQRNNRLASSVLNRSRDLNSSEGAIPLFPVQFPPDSSAISEGSSRVKCSEGSAHVEDAPLPADSEIPCKSETIQLVDAEISTNEVKDQSTFADPYNSGPTTMSYARVAKEAAALPDEVEPSGYQKLVDSSAQSIAPVAAVAAAVSAVSAVAPVHKVAKPKVLSEHQRKKREDRRLAFEAKKAAEHAEQIVDDNGDFEIVTKKKKAQPESPTTPKIAWSKPEASAKVSEEKVPTAVPVAAPTTAPIAHEPKKAHESVKPQKKHLLYASEVRRVDSGQAEVICNGKTVQIAFEIKFYANKWTVEFNYRNSAITVNGGKIAAKAEPRLDFEVIAAKIREGIAC